MNSPFDQLIRGGRASSQERSPAVATAVAARRPQVSLMPAEVMSDAQGKRIRAGLAGVVFGFAALTVGAALVSGQTVADADARSAASSQQLSSASAQLAKFKDVQALQEQIALLQAAQRVGSSTAIDWQQQIGLIEADMPSGLVVTGIQADSATPFADYPQGTTPLDRERVASVQVSGTTSSIAGLPLWLRKLKDVPSYADATPTVSAGNGGEYSVQVTIHLAPDAYITPLKGRR